VTPRQDAGAAHRSSTPRRVVVAGLTALVTFGGSAVLDGALDVPVTDQLILAAIVGSITLVVPLVQDFDARLRIVEQHAASQLERLERRQAAQAEQTRGEIDAVFTRISRATRLFEHIERSALQTDAIVTLVELAGQVNGANTELVRNLAQHEIKRLSGLLRSLTVGHMAFYDGEDRDWLLGLTNEAQKSIVATSLATVDAGGRGFEGGHWMNDLGYRYLDLQRGAHRRGVKIRRIFVFDRPELVADPGFVRVRNLQLDAGVHIRILDSSMVPRHLQGLIFDFVIFDDTVSYETTLATSMVTGVRPSIVTTQLILDRSRVLHRVTLFEELWAAASDVG
jgi:hypothetical protein